MITAADAREIQKLSGVKVQEILCLIEPQIRECAEKGLGEYACYIDRELWTSVEAYNVPMATALQVMVMSELRKHGYTAVFATHGDRYVPRAFEDQDGGGPVYQNWCIIIRW